MVDFSVLSERTEKDDPSPASYPFSSSISISHRFVFYWSKHSIAFVNKRPILPHHVLVIPRRIVRRFKDLTSEELIDLWLSVQLISAALEEKQSVSACTINIQDGKDAGQKVDHLHVHILPRYNGDFAVNDEVYEKLEQFDYPTSIKERFFGVDPCAERRERSEEEMEHEADELKLYFRSLAKE